MSRSDWESRLIRLQFDEDSEEIDKLFDDLLCKEETKSSIIATLFERYRDTLRHACVDAAATPEEEGRAAGGELTNPDAVWKHLSRVRTFRENLLLMNDQELVATYRESWRAAANSIATRKEAAGRRRDAFDFFNEPSADADFGFWLKVGSWTIEEAVALSMGKNPRLVNSMTLAVQDKVIQQSPFRDEFKRRIFLLERAQQGGYLKANLPRDDLTEWFAANDVSVPAELLGDNKNADLNFWKIKCLEIERELALQRTAEADDNLETSGKIKKKTVYRALLGMAICAYGHRLAGSSPAPLSIERDLALLREHSADELKLSVGDDKIREMFEEAANLLSISWQGNIDFIIFEAWRQKNRR